MNYEKLDCAVFASTIYGQICFGCEKLTFMDTRVYSLENDRCLCFWVLTAIAVEAVCINHFIYAGCCNRLWQDAENRTLLTNLLRKNLDQVWCKDFSFLLSSSCCFLVFSIYKSFHLVLFMEITSVSTMLWLICCCCDLSYYIYFFLMMCRDQKCYR